MTRYEAYCWLARSLGLSEPKAHMSRMRDRKCLQRVVVVCDGLMGSTEVEDDFSSAPPIILTS